MQKTRLYRPGEPRPEDGKAKRGGGGAAPSLGGGEDRSQGPEWVKKNPRQASKQGLYAAALSSDGKLLAVGGGDRKVWKGVVWRAPLGALWTPLKSSPALQIFPDPRL